MTAITGAARICFALLVVTAALPIALAWAIANAVDRMNAERDALLAMEFTLAYWGDGEDDHT